MACIPERRNSLCALTAMVFHFSKEDSKQLGSVAVALIWAQVSSVYQVTPISSA